LKVESVKTYLVRRCANGGGDPVLRSNHFWNDSQILSDFSYPWENVASPLLEFGALYDDHWLYCNFVVQDEPVLTYIHESKKEEVLFGDRVEIFFATEQSLGRYYCLEIDPNGRVYDYEASHYRKFNADWQWPSEHLHVGAKKSDGGYEVSVAIGMKSLRNLGLIHNGGLLAGIFRGKCMAINLNEDRMRWISWVTPDSSFPDFHVPSAFGVLRLE
jgi:hypothetical protein